MFNSLVYAVRGLLVVGVAALLFANSANPLANPSNGQSQLTAGGEPNYFILDLQVLSNPESSQYVMVLVRIKNVGGESEASQTVEIRLDDQLLDAAELNLAPGEVVDLEYTALAIESGSHQVQVVTPSSSAQAQFTVGVP